MTFKHGVSTTKADTAVSSPLVAGSGIPFVVGTAPAHLTGGPVNEIVLALSQKDAVSAFGFSSDFEKYTLCEVISSHFVVFGMAPLLLVNVLDKERMKTDEPATELPVVFGMIKLPLEAILETVAVKSVGDDTLYVLGTDYDVSFDRENVIIEIIKDGAISENASSLIVSYSRVDPSKVKKDDIIGGFDPANKKTTGLELIKYAFSKYGIVPDLILAPGYSHIPEVAAVMAAKAAKIGGLFFGKALIDAPASFETKTDHYSLMSEWKTNSGASEPEQLVFWPQVKIGEQKYHMSTIAASIIAQTDQKNGSPYESPSNKNTKATALCLEDGSEVVLDIDEANYLNANGIITGLNFSGHKLWGNMTAAYPAMTDVKDTVISTSRMLDFIANTLKLTTWSKIDDPMNVRLVTSIADTFNIWLNGLAAEGKLLGGRVEFNESENPITNLQAGIIKYHVYATPPGAAQEIGYIIEYDASHLASLFA